MNFHIAKTRMAIGWALLAFVLLVGAASARENALVARMLAAGDSPFEQAVQAEGQFRAFVEQLRASGTVAGDPRSRAKAIHQFIHREILRGPYEIGGNDLATALSGGAFNCVTASGLFLALAAEFDLEAQPVSVLGHVWCRVTTPSGPFDVENTCRGWIDLSALKPSQTRLYSEYHERAARARVLNESGFIALFHYNRALRLLKEQRFHAAAAANLEALKLDPNCEPAQENLLVTLNDWSLALAAHGQQAASLELLQKASALSPEYQPFRVNYRFIFERQPTGATPSPPENRVIQDVPNRENFERPAKPTAAL